jgi:group I intron endonuclease
MGERLWYIYTILNSRNGSAYVGWTVDPDQRWAQHQRNPKSPLGYYLYRAMRKYGVANFTFAVVETWPSELEAKDAEIWMIAYLKSLGARLYNMTEGGEGTTGWVPSEETRAIWRRQRTGKKASPETKAKMSKTRKGKPLSEKNKRGISEGQRGRVCIWKGKKLPPETCEKIRLANLQRWASTDRSHQYPARVLGVLADGCIRSAFEIAQALGGSPNINMIYAVLSKLTRAGKIERVSPGRYKV